MKQRDLALMILQTELLHPINRIDGTRFGSFDVPITRLICVGGGIANGAI
jgi:hypothetical protein